MKTLLKSVLIIGLPLAITGCIPVLLGGGAAAGGYAVAKDNGPVGQYTDDSVITSKVKGKLLTDKYIRSSDISVVTNDGVVTLTGTVPTVEMRNRAIDIVRHTKDVKAVNVINFKVAN